MRRAGTRRLRRRSRRVVLAMGPTDDAGIGSRSRGSEASIAAAGGSRDGSGEVELVDQAACAQESEADAAFEPSGLPAEWAPRVGFVTGPIGVRLAKLMALPTGESARVFRFLIALVAELDRADSGSRRTPLE